MLLSRDLFYLDLPSHALLDISNTRFNNATAAEPAATTTAAMAGQQPTIVSIPVTAGDYLLSASSSSSSPSANSLITINGQLPTVSDGSGGDLLSLNDQLVTVTSQSIAEVVEGDLSSLAGGGEITESMVREAVYSPSSQVTH